MARSRSQRRRRRPFSRVLVPVLVGGCLVFAGYFLLPGDQPETAQAAGDAPVPKAAPLTEKSSRLAETAPVKPSVKDAGASEPKKPVEPPKSPPQTPATSQPATIGPAAPPAFMARANELEGQEKFLEARKVLNDALQAGTLDHATAEATKARIRELNQRIIFTPNARFPDDPQQSSYTVEPGDLLAKICRELPVPHGFIARVNAVKPERIRPKQSLKLITVPIHAVVSKKHFTMDMYLGALPGQPGSMYLTTYRVGLGEDGSTPTGTWEITPGSKTVNPAWDNPRTGERFDADDPKNPLGERWIGLTGISGDAIGAVSYGIHGTIEPDSIGKNASMGCIRLAADDVAAIFDMLSDGSSTVLVVKE